jgi:hypothetical protein
MASKRTQATCATVGAAVLVLLTVRGVQGHKGNTSKYTYNDDIYPLLRDKCGRCHVDGGPAPMSLLTYQDAGGAVAWAQSIREMLVAGVMPPWPVDPTSPAVRNSEMLTPRELDMIVTWATGGTPQGDLRKKPPPAVADTRWPLGAPDLVIPFDKEYTLPAGVMEAQTSITAPTGFAATKWVKAVDLLPGTPSLVRQATIAIDGGQVLAVWEPGDNPATAPAGTAFKISPGAALRVDMRYKKSWQDEQVAKSDKSAVGLYFTDEPLSGRAIESFLVEPPPGESPPVFGASLTTGGRVLAVRPRVDRPYATVEVAAIAPSGRKVPLLKLRSVRPEWPRRYWLFDAIDLPAGSRIEMTTTPGDPDAGPLAPPVSSPLQLALDINVP